MATDMSFARRMFRRVEGGISVAARWMMLVAAVSLPVTSFVPVAAQAQTGAPSLADDLADILDTRSQPAAPSVSPSANGRTPDIRLNPVGGDASLAPPATTVGPIMPSVKEVHPFGSQLFTSTSSLLSPRGVNPNYIIAPGDQVSVQIWGAQSYSGTQAVDPQGNIFLPEIGPIQVGGQTVSNVSSTINYAIRKIYTNNVNAYVTVLGRQPVGVYVTGSVRMPGRYAGERFASPLTFMAQAGGIDPRSGSYRDIRVLRGGAVLAHIDLYEFLLMGRMPGIQFEENDTIMVGTQGTTVVAHGEVQNRYRFEVAVGQVRGADVTALARPDASVSHVSIKGVRNNQPYNAYMTLGEFAGAAVQNGDDYTFVTDRVTETIFVSVTGQSAGPSSFAVVRGARLGDVLKLIEVDPNMADIESIYLRRVSVADRQQRALEMSLNELQRTVLTSTSTTGTEAIMRTQEAQLVERFIAKARTVAPEGRVVLANIPNRDELRLEADDVIVIPDKSQVVMIAGEVRIPQTLLWQRGRTVREYVDAAGGFTDRAATGNFVVIRRSGAAQVGTDIEIQPGDQVMIMPTAGEKGFAIMHDLIEVIYRVAVSSAVVLNAVRYR